MGVYLWTLLSYSDIVSMATTEGYPRTNTLAELNSIIDGYHNSLSDHLTIKTALNSQQYDTIDGISYYSEGNGTFRICYKAGAWSASLFFN